MKIAVIGFGWYGGHISRQLKREKHDITVLEAEPHILGRVSGMFGIRDHAGPHYPRSPKTRESCRRGAEEFDSLYPELIITHEYSVYGVGARDSSGMPSKVDVDHFRQVCMESKGYRELRAAEWGYNSEQMIAAFGVHEPSIAVGVKLRETWERYIQEDNIAVKYNYTVKKIERHGSKVIINDELEFDGVVNATSFQSFVPPKPLPFQMNIKYQVCLALVYEDRRSTHLPFSLIVMDGEFPCLMPYDDLPEGYEEKHRNYIMTHGKWTIMCSKDTPEEARQILDQITDRFVKKKVKPRCEQHMKEFWPKFSDRFVYKGWKGNILAKPKSGVEFRSAITFAHVLDSSSEIPDSAPVPDSEHFSPSEPMMVQIVPGKVTNVVDAARETSALFKGEKVIAQGKYRYVSGGVLDEALHEINAAITVRNTCDLQTYDELLQLTEIEDTALISPKKEFDNVFQFPQKKDGASASAPIPIIQSIDQKQPVSLPGSYTTSPPPMQRRMSAEF